MNFDFSDGVQEIVINGKCTVYANLTDGTFIESVFNAFNALDALEDEYRPRIEDATAASEVFSLSRERDAKMREIVNGIFEQDVCSPVFGKMQLNAAADGLPLWANMLLTFIDNMDSALTEEKTRTNPRLKRYVDKYKKYQKQK